MKSLIVCAAVSAMFWHSSAHGQSWETITQPGGYKVARVTMSGGATGLGLTCERGVPVLAVSLTRAPRRNPALLTIRSGAGSNSFGILRNGTTNVWVASVKDLRLLDMLAGGGAVSLAVDGAAYSNAMLTGADAAIRTALAGCWKPPPAAAAPAQAVSPGSDEDEVRAIVGMIYGWRDGRPVKVAETWQPDFTPRVDALIAQCEAAVANADPKANGGEGSYTVTGDQGCYGVPFLVDPVLGDPAPFIRTVRPVVQRIGSDMMTSEIVVPATFRSDWGSGEIIRFQRIGGRWLIDDIVTKRPGGAQTYSSGIAEMIAELRKIARKPAALRRR